MGARLSKRRGCGAIPNIGCMTFDHASLGHVSRDMQPIGFAPNERSLVVHHVTRGQVTRGQMSLWSNVAVVKCHAAVGYLDASDASGRLFVHLMSMTHLLVLN